MIALACLGIGLAVVAVIVFIVLRKIVADDWRALGRTCLTGEGLKFFAFAGASGAGVAMSAYLVWNTAFLHTANKADYVFYLAAGSMLLLGLTQLSLHRLLGAKQAIEIEFWKLKAKLSQGEDTPTATTTKETLVATKTVSRVPEPPVPTEEPFVPGGAP